MPRAKKVCSGRDCIEVVDRGRCEACDLAAEKRRGTSRQRGYDRRHERLFRERVLTRHPLCVCATRGHGHGAECLRPSKHADHWPVDRDELVRRGQNPNDSRHGRGLCPRCHSAETAANQPGGWNAR
jgi:5-methylcytosine-specific restriction protein A